MQQTRKPKLFYGWYVLWGMILVGAMAMALAGPTYGLFIEPMREELGFGRALFGWTQTVYLLSAAIGGLFIGRLIDRYGARVLLAVAGGVAAVVLGSLSFFHPPWWFIGAFLITGLMGIHGPASIYGAPVISKWFVRQRARALGILSMGAPFGLLIGFPAGTVGHSGTRLADRLDLAWHRRTGHHRPRVAARPEAAAGRHRTHAGWRPPAAGGRLRYAGRP